jgi:hypothetical protein
MSTGRNCNYDKRNTDFRQYSICIKYFCKPVIVVSTQYIYGGFFPGIPVSSINKTDRSDINKISLKVALNTINLQTYLRFTVSPWPFSAFSGSPCETCIYTTIASVSFIDGGNWNTRKKPTINVLGTTNHTNSGVISGVLCKQLH